MKDLDTAAAYPHQSHNKAQIRLLPSDNGYHRKTRFLFLYLVYFAASLAASKNLHIRVTAQLKLLPKLGQMLLLLATDIIWLIFCIIVMDVGTDFIISMSDRPMVSGALMLDMRYVYAAVPIAFTLQAVRLVERWWRIFTKRDPLVVPSEEVF